jgi:hypothetical protein
MAAKSRRVTDFWRIFSMKRNMETYLNTHCGERAPKLLADPKSFFDTAVSKITNKSDSQRKTLLEKILPRIALYKALQKNGYSSTEAFDLVEGFMRFQLTPMVNMLKKVDRCAVFIFDSQENGFGQRECGQLDYGKCASR